MNESGSASDHPEAVSDDPELPEGLADCLSDEAILGAFRSLPATDQRNFIRWVSTSDSSTERLRRGLIPRDALRLSPLRWESRPDLPNRQPG